MSSESPPPSPILSHATRREARQKERRISRSSSNTHSRDLGKPSGRDLARLLLFEEREANDLRKMLLTVTEQLKEESQRADENERRAREAILRFKAVNDARMLAQQETARVNEELRLYKLQLDNAQREINKAQEILDSVETQRYDAEASAARARSTARQIKEARLVDLAREEGRRLGMQAGLARGQRVGFERARTGYRGRVDSDSAGPYPEDDVEDVASYGSRDVNLEPIEDPMLNYTPSSVDEEDEATPLRTTPPLPTQPVSPPSVVLHSPSGDIHPTPVRNTPSPSHHPESIIPLDGFIPHADADSTIRLPPPHEMQRAPPTPDTAPVLDLPLPQDDVPLMVPNPGVRRDYPSLEEISRTRPLRRPVSPESQGSTTISQFELVSEPNVPNYRPSRNRGSRALSMIPESISGHTTPATGPRSLAGDASRPASVSPSGRGGSVRGSPHPTPVAAPVNPVMVPMPHAASSDIPGLEEQSKYIYRRPSFASSSSESNKPGSAARTPIGSDRSLNRRSSSSIPDITIQPPSRPSSQTPQQTPATTHGDFLSAEDAANRPMPPPGTPPTPEPRSLPSMIPPIGMMPLPSSPGGAPIVLDELPPGFVPTGPPAPVSSQTPIYSPAGVPLPSSGTTVYSESRGGWGSQTPRTVQTPLSAASQMASAPGATPGSRRARNGGFDPIIVSAPSSSSNSSAVVPDRSLLSRTGSRPDDSDSLSDDGAISSSIASSNDTLTTPPPRSRRLPNKSPGPTYAAAPTPANIQYPTTPTVRTMSTPGTATRVPLPPSTSAGSPYTAASYTPRRSAINLNAGMTPGARNSSLRR
ncbi:hypothetical protein EVG20_g1580 [Dentipellis fragilis]|uniref:Uncharacterized protein n=1 Tax=Dentipellis fragilis TaxID=205917 RepID=A0A4Y9ZCA6_9AGAM|nr:hypothetical protein EVG20_g1580 [Dentipellis fragilis]